MNENKLTIKEWENVGRQEMDKDKKRKKWPKTKWSKKKWREKKIDGRKDRERERKMIEEKTNRIRKYITHTHRRENVFLLFLITKLMLFILNHNP